MTDLSKAGFVPRVVPLRRAVTLPALAAGLMLAACAGDSTGPVGAQKPSVLAVGVDRPAVTGEWETVLAGGAALEPTDRVAVSDSSVAMVDPDGRLFPTSSGTLTITVQRYSGTTLTAEGSMAVTVAPTPAQQFPITFDFIGWTPTFAQHAAFERAAARLQTVLVAQDPPMTVTLAPGGQCIPEGATYQGVVGLVVRVTLADPPAGGGAPCVMTADYHAKLAYMQLDRSAVSALSTSNRWADMRTLENMILHFTGHGLGLVAISPAATNYVAATSSGVFFTGPQAEAAYTTLTGAAGGVPIDGGQGHWNLSLTATRDIMLPPLDTIYQRLSPLTLGALVDIGYSVQPGRAEPLPTVNQTSSAQFSVIEVPRDRYPRVDALLDWYRHHQAPRAE